MTDSQSKIDIPLLVLTILFGLTLLFYIYGVFPYPYGVLIIIIMIIARVLATREKTEPDRKP